MRHISVSGTIHILEVAGSAAGGMLVVLDEIGTGSVLSTAYVVPRISFILNWI